MRGSLGPSLRGLDAMQGRGHACLLAILGSLPFRIPACIVPILSCNVLSIWTRCSKAWDLLLSGSMAAATAILPELDPFFMLPDTGFIIDPRRSELTRILLRCQCLLAEKVCRYVKGGLSESTRV